RYGSTTCRARSPAHSQYSPSLGREAVWLTTDGISEVSRTLGPHPWEVAPPRFTSVTTCHSTVLARKTGGMRIARTADITNQGPGANQMFNRKLHVAMFAVTGLTLPVAVSEAGNRVPQPVKIIASSPTNFAPITSPDTSTTPPTPGRL